MSLTAALELADSLELDLVEIGMQDGLVLTKLMDYGKYLFKQQKNLSHNRAQSKKAEMKTLKITYRMADHDMEIRKNQAIRFAQDKHPLKVMLQLRGRENQYEKIAGEKVNQFLASISDIYKVEGNVSKTGNTFAVMLYPKN